MEFDYSEEQQMLRASVARFAETRYGLRELRACQATGAGWMQDNWRFFAGQGWLALPFAEELGGLGGSLEDLAVLLCEFGRAHVLEPYVSSAVICGGILADCGRRDLIEAVIAGELTLAFAHGESARPADPAAVGTTRSGTGGLRGVKRLVPDAAAAGKLIVSALGDDGPELRLVDAAQPGISVSPYKLIDGSSAADIRLDIAGPDAGERLAGGPDAREMIRAALRRGTLANLALAVGAIEACLAATGRYVAERRQFGQPIGKFQALQHILAGMFVDAQDSRSALYRAIAHWHDGTDPQIRALASAKVMIGRCGERVSRAAIQLHGGYGMTEEFVVGHHFRRLVVLEKLWGDTDHHLRLLAECA